MTAVLIYEIRSRNQKGRPRFRDICLPAQFPASCFAYEPDEEEDMLDSIGYALNLKGVFYFEIRNSSVSDKWNEHGRVAWIDVRRQVKRIEKNRVAPQRRVAKNILNKIADAISAYEKGTAS